MTALGLAFQRPIRPMLLSRVGGVTAEGLAKFRKYALILVVTPAARLHRTSDAVTPSAGMNGNRHNPTTSPVVWDHAVIRNTEARRAARPPVKSDAPKTSDEARAISAVIGATLGLRSVRRRILSAIDSGELGQPG